LSVVGLRTYHSPSLNFSVLTYKRDIEPQAQRIAIKVS